MIGSILKCIVGGRWKTAIFSVTSACNCRCSMCNIPNLQPQHLPPNAALEILRQCVKNKVAILSVTGGEPFLYPHLPTLVKRAKEMGFIIHIATNGTLPNKIGEVGDFVDAIGFSIDSHVASEHNNNRKHEGALERCREGVENCKKMGIRSFANTPPNEYIVDKIEEYVSFINDEVGIPVGFCYPETQKGDYFPNGENIVSKLNSERIADFFRTVLKLKRSDYNILNSDIFLKEAAEYAKGNLHKVSHCGAGRVVYWIDWAGNVYPCFTKKAILNGEDIWQNHNPNGCNDCFVQCFREPSSFISNLPFSLMEVKHLGYLSLGVPYEKRPHNKPPSGEITSPLSR